MHQFLLLVLLIVRCSHHGVESLSSLDPPRQQEAVLVRPRTRSELLVLGLGRVGSQVAHLAVPRFDGRVVGTVRRQPGHREGHHDDGIDDGIVRISFDPAAVQERLGDGAGSATTHVLLTIPLSREPDPVFQMILEQAKEWWSKPSHPGQSDKWIGIVSTTGVYGNHDGAWVTEDSPLLCEAGGNADLYRTLEEDWMQLGRDLQSSSPSSSNRICIFRCAGIYDSSRSALHTLYNSRSYGRPALTSPPPSPPGLNNGGKTNRIHSFDLSRAVLASMLPERDGGVQPPTTAVGVYNLADDLPEYRTVVLAYANELLSRIADGLPPPLESIADTKSYSALPSQTSAGRKSRRQRERKLVDNGRMRRELLVGNEGDGDGLRFPTYREGLQTIFDDPSSPWQLMVQSQASIDGRATK